MNITKYFLDPINNNPFIDSNFLQTPLDGCGNSYAGIGSKIYIIQEGDLGRFDMVNKEWIYPYASVTEKAWNPC